MNNNPIGIFDSGIGGLTVLKEYMKILPNEDYIYYADTANLPYGDKNKEQIIEYASKIVTYFISRNVKAIIIACGTASSLAYQYLIKNFDIPIFNIIEPVAKNLKEKDIGIIATAGSISSHVWENEIRKFNPESTITSVACPKLVPLAEKGLTNSSQAKNAIKNYLKIFKAKKISSLILGCTHYPLFSDIIEKELGKDVKLINTGIYSANEFKQYLEQNNLFNDTQNISKVDYIVSGNKNIFIQNANMLGMKIMQPERTHEKTPLLISCKEGS